MSYTYNGTQIRISHPVHSISVNNRNVAFADKCGQKKARFANVMDARAFLNWLINSSSN